MTTAMLTLLAWTPFIHPLVLPSSARLWMFPPLALCIALVYRAARAPSTEKLLRRSSITFINIVVGMWSIALAVYGIHALVLWLA